MPISNRNCLRLKSSSEHPPEPVGDALAGYTPQLCLIKLSNRHV